MLKSSKQPARARSANSEWRRFLHDTRTLGYGHDLGARVCACRRAAGGGHGPAGFGSSPVDEPGRGMERRRFSVAPLGRKGKGAVPRELQPDVSKVLRGEGNLRDAF